MRKRIPSVLFALVTACATGRGSAGDEQVARLNEASGYRADRAAGAPQLALEVEVTEGGVTPVAAGIVRAPRPTSRGIADLRVAVLAGDRTVLEYFTADPRLAEVEKQGAMVLPSARTIVFAPLEPAPTDLVIQPAPGKENVSRGGRIALGSWIAEACRKARETPACRPYLEAVPGTPTAPGTPGAPTTPQPTTPR
jgi:hypothetical protein